MFTSPYADSTYADGKMGSGPLYQFQPPLVQDIPWHLPTSHGPAGQSTNIISDNANWHAGF